ncbi:MAG: trehalase family glycosidase [Candidatus Saccharimonadales bacterium]|jgi:alpha,alpha-trehalase
MFSFKTNTISLPKLGSSSVTNPLSAEDVSAAREYIAKYWSNITFYHPKSCNSQLGLPKPYLVPAFHPNNEFDFNELYYWDSYFMIQALLDEKHRELVLGIAEDLLLLFHRFGIIPNASRTYLTGHSQPPFLTSIIFDIYGAYNLDNSWLKKGIDIAKEEYAHVWMGTAKPNARKVYKGLSRYYDINYLNDLAEAESGWDMTTRFNRRALNYLPIDLNSLLYKYEVDFAQAAYILGNKSEAKKWEDTAKQRQSIINKLMWNKGRGAFYDYDYKKEKRSSINSLASYYPLWSGLATNEQAFKLARNLKRFEHQGGLATTDTLPFGKFITGTLPTQWAYPNGWAPLHYIVVKGLQKYGYQKDAYRIAMKWLKTNLNWFNNHGEFLEKYNVIQPLKPPVNGLYPNQTGFGWTNAVFEYFCQEFIDRAVI